MSFKQTVVKAFIWDYISKMARQFVTFIISVILARILGPEEFGVIAIANVFVTFSNIFIDSGISTSIIQNDNINEKHLNSAFVFNIIVGFTFSLILFLSSNIIFNFYNYDNLKEVIEFISLIFIINSFVIVQQARYQKELKLKFISLVLFISSIISGIIALVFVYNGYGVFSLVIQILSDRLIYTIIFYIKTDWLPKFQFDSKSFFELWNYAKFIFYNQFIRKLISSLGTLFIGKLFDATTLGFYNRATRLNNFLFRFISESLRKTMFPVYSKIQKETNRIIKVTKLNIKILSLLLILFSGIIFLNSNEFIILLLTKKWVKTADYLNILIFSGISLSINQLFIDVLKGRGLSKLMFKISQVINSLRLINLLLISFYGVIGFIYGILVLGLLYLIILNYYVSKELKCGKFELITSLFKYVLIGFLSISITLIINNHVSFSFYFHILLNTMIYSLIYLSIIYYFNISNVREITILLKELYQFRKIKTFNE